MPIPFDFIISGEKFTLIKHKKQENDLMHFQQQTQIAYILSEWEWVLLNVERVGH